MIKKAIQFIGEVWMEVKKVDWPRPGKAFNYTLVVIGGSVFFAVFLGGFDSLFSLFLNKFVIG